MNGEALSSNGLQEVKSEVVKAAPAVGVTGLSFFGVGLQDWVYVATILYTVTQTALLLWKTWRKYKERKNEPVD